MVKKKSDKYCKKNILLAVAAVFAIIALSFVAYQIYQKQESKVDSLVIYHWWPSAGEQVAFSALLNMFIEGNPSTLIVSAPLKGGVVRELARAKEVVEPSILSNEAPDILQLHVGYGTKEYYDAGLLNPVTSSWESTGLESTTPRIVKSMCRFDGEYYCLPMNVHRTNVVWYNKHVLDSAGIDPESIDTWDDFFEACDKLKTSGVEYPVQMAEAWTEQLTFDQIIASIGIEFYEDWVNGDVNSVDDERLSEAFDIFDKYMSYANPDLASTGWDTATGRIINGEGAFYIMGDWANAEFLVEDKVYGEDYGTFMVPGTASMYGLVMDGFQIAKNSKHDSNAKKWMDLVASVDGQDTFNPLKGSIPIRRDADVNKYGDYQKAAIYDFGVTEVMYPALSSGAPKSFELTVQNTLAEYVANRDKDAAISKLVSHINDISDEYVIEWDLN